MIVGFLIGMFGGIFIGVVITSLCVVSSWESRREELNERID